VIRSIEWGLRAKTMTTSRSEELDKNVNAEGEHASRSMGLGRETNSSLREFDEQFRLLIETVKDYAIFILAPDGTIATWNAGAERFKGYRSEEIIGHSFTCFYVPEDIESGKPARELSIATKEGRYEEEGWRVPKDGSRFWANVVITALRDAEGKLVGFGKVTRDVTERKRADEQLRRSEAHL